MRAAFLATEFKNQESPVGNKVATASSSLVDASRPAQELAEAAGARFSQRGDALITGQPGRVQDPTRL